MHVLEQVQRQRARAVEQQHVALLQIVEIADRDLAQQKIELAPHRGRKQSLPIHGGGDFGDGFLKLGRRIAQQHRQRLEGSRHHITSIGVLARFGVPNRLVWVVPPEQPLPKVNPHEPRRS